MLSIYSIFPYVMGIYTVSSNKQTNKVYILFHQTNKQTKTTTNKQQKRLAFTYVHKCRSSNRPWCFSGGRSHVYPGRESVRWDRTCSTGCSGHRHSVCPAGCLHVAALAAPTPAGSCSATKHHLQWRRRITTGAFIFSVCLSVSPSLYRPSVQRTAWPLGAKTRAHFLHASYAQSLQRREFVKTWFIVVLVCSHIVLWFDVAGTRLANE